VFPAIVREPVYRPAEPADVRRGAVTHVVDYLTVFAFFALFAAFAFKDEFARPVTHFARWQPVA
jgi:hypothetical protein